MTISNAIFKSINYLLYNCVDNYDEPQEILWDADVREAVACLLKIDNRRSFCKPSKEDLKRINAIDWKKKARDHIYQYLKDRNLFKDDSDSELSGGESDEDKA